MKDQQEAERKKMASQEIQQALEAQTKVIAEKQESVRNDLAQVEPAVIEAQQGNYVLVVTILILIPPFYNGRTMFVEVVLIHLLQSFPLLVVVGGICNKVDDNCECFFC